ncbi:MAG: hypothetical protein AB7V50_07785 [Vampirovibrionia bacterium]
MNIGSFGIMAKYTMHRFKKSPQSFVNSFVNNTKTDVFNFVDLYSGKKQKQCQEELAKLNKQLDIIQRNLNTSLSNSPQFIDILR